MRSAKIEQREFIDTEGISHHLVVELADEYESRIQGLSDRDDLDCDGMLFDHREPSFVPMTAARMRFPLQVQWFDTEGNNVGVEHMEPGQYGPFWSKAAARYVLETKPGPVFRQLVHREITE